nr:hypothetical protein [Novosphingobium silvae]
MSAVIASMTILNVSASSFSVGLRSGAHGRHQFRLSDDGAHLLAVVAVGPEHSQIGIAQVDVLDVEERAGLVEERGADPFQQVRRGDEPVLHFQIGQRRQVFGGIGTCHRPASSLR